MLSQQMLVLQIGICKFEMLYGHVVHSEIKNIHVLCDFKIYMPSDKHKLHRMCTLRMYSIETLKKKNSRHVV